MFKVIAIQRNDIRLFHDFTAAIRTTLKGRAVAPGMAEGTALIYMPLLLTGSDDTRISQKAVEAEKHRIDHAISATVTELNFFRNPSSSPSNSPDIRENTFSQEYRGKFQRHHRRQIRQSSGIGFLYGWNYRRSR